MWHTCRLFAALFIFGLTLTPVFGEQDRNPPIAVGTLAPAVHAKDLSGNAVTFDFAGQPTVLYIISPTCTFCVENTPNLNELWRQRSTEYRFLAMSLRRDGLDEYLARSPLKFPTYALQDGSIAEWGFGVTPATIVVGKDGRVVKKFNGAWTAGGSLPSVEKFFGVKLPGAPATTEK